MIRTHRVTRRAASFALAAGLALTTMTSGAAHATDAGAPGPWKGPSGKNTARNELVVRCLPTTFSNHEGLLLPVEVFPIVCKVQGTVVHKDDDENGAVSNLWYRLPGSSHAWVSALYVTNVDGRIPRWCGDGSTYRGRVTGRLLVQREAPTTRANSHSALTKGTSVRILCKLRGQEVGGNDLWYALPQGLWVAARYVADVGAAPAYCR